MSEIKYQPSIDGLRAIAVIAVILFHLDKGILSGGFVGVDVFFVISGYLITTIIYQESYSGKFSFLKFYQRRIARIFPLQLLTTLAILLAAYFIYSPQDFASSGAVAISSALSLTNLKLMMQGNYFEVSPDAQPFLHFWSLAVEEQFYLLLPFVIWAHFRLGASKRLLLVNLAFATIGSFLACVALTYYRPNWAFYLLPTRAWELLAGSILALSFPAESNGSSPRLRQGLAALGLVVITGSFFLINESRSFPGFLATLPVVGAVLLIYGTVGADHFVEKLLSNRVLRFIGKLSYSLYLWHWPIFCFVDYSLFELNSLSRGLLKICLMCPFGLVSLVWFEIPLRRYFAEASRKRLCFGLFFSLTFVVAYSGYCIRVSNYFSSSLSEVAHGGRSQFYGSSSPSVVLMGDSNASMYGGLTWKIAKDCRYNLNIISVDAGNPLPGSELYAESLRFLEKASPDVTIYVVAWAGKLIGREDDIRKALEEILQHSKHVVLIEQPPVLPEFVGREYFRRNGAKPVFETSGFASRKQIANEFLRSLQGDRVHVIDANSSLLKRNGEVVFVDERGRQLFHDRAHLSGYGADKLRRPLEELLAELLKK